MPQSTHAKVLIAGGSIAGLTLANAFERVGIEYILLERWHEIAPDVGASIVIFPNGARILDQLGCYNAVQALNQGSCPIDVLLMRDEKGKVIFKLNNPSKIFIER